MQYRHSALTSLNLAYTNITMGHEYHGFDARYSTHAIFNRFAGLKELDLSGNRMPDVLVAIVLHHTSLRNLSLLAMNRCFLGQETLPMLGEYIASNSSLRSLDVGRNTFKNYGIGELLADTATHLTTLKLNNVHMHQAAFADFCNRLRGNSTLTHLTLSPVRATGLGYIAEWIAVIYLSICSKF
jgi:hypothetical protein